MTTTEPPPKRTRRPIWQLLLAALVPAAIVVAALYFMLVTKPEQENIEAAHKTALQYSGLNRPTTTKLDPRFADADNDPVADTPTDGSKQLDPPTLAFCYISVAPDPEDPKPDAYQIAFAEFVQHLSKMTGKNVEYKKFGSAND